MNTYKKFAVTFLILELLMLVVLNVYGIKGLQKKQERYYQVDISRIVSRMEQGENLSDIELHTYQTVHAVSVFDPAVHGKYAYTVEKVGGVLYKFEYEENRDRQLLFLANGIFAVILLATLFLFVYMDQKLIRPFSKIRNLPKELAKGNLSMPIPEEKSKYFGQFLWGMDHLRETLEDDKKRELELLKEKKTLILSLSHDIKTPLSAIELYTRALRTNLYDSEEKKQEAYNGIEKNAGQIKRYVSEITDASKEDFLSLSVTNGEVYLSACLDRIREYYTEKFKRLHMEFLIEPYDDCLVYGDKERIIEVMQNILENAIKYGDGKKVELAFDEEENCKLITIRNTGCELGKDELVHVFESFYRGSNSKNAEGSGLGLYIGKKLMQKMEGDLFAQLAEDRFEMTMVIRKM